MPQKTKSQNYLMSGIGIKTIGLIILVTVQACRKPSLEGKFYFVNNTSQTLELKCFLMSRLRVDDVIQPGQFKAFSFFIFNSYYSIPNQMDSIIIESEGRVFFESCPYRSQEDRSFPERDCELSERSMFNHKAYERIDKKRSKFRDYYYYFTDADLARLK